MEEGGRENVRGAWGSFITLAAFPEAAGSVDGVNGWEAGLRDGTGLRSHTHNPL